MHPRIDEANAHPARQPWRLVYDTACALAQSATVVEAAPRMLEAICEALHWEYGGLWMVGGQPPSLHSAATWHHESLQFDEFAAFSQETRFDPGVGLPGRVWVEPAAGLDSRRDDDSNFPRGPVAARVGLHAAFGFPILRGDRGPRRDGVLQPRDPAARRGACCRC